jgi:hypothetical protein
MGLNFNRNLNINNLKTMSFNNFKDKLYQHLENIRYADFFKEIEESVHIFDTTTLARLKQDIIWSGVRWEQHESLVLFVSTIQENGKPENQPSPPPYTKADIDALSFDHAFRPEMTKNLLQKMCLHGQCLNLYGRKGIGKGRMLQDLKKCEPELRNSKFIPIDMKYHVENHARFLEKLARECGVVGQNLGQIIDKTKEKAHLFLLLDNFEEVFDNPKKDKHYNSDFFDELNGLKNAGQKLIVVTQERHTSHILDGRKSWLTVNEYEMPEHSYTQVSAEIKRRLPKVAESELTYLAEQFETDSYELMNKVMNELLDLENPHSIKEEAKKLIKKYRR